ncbi:MAG TPA: hypothetical protein VI461_11505, partial [Chitinophagaceae bacterium]|nr:hypothetical protein [Chitinophagaceae bacterium]
MHARKYILLLLFLAGGFARSQNIYDPVYTIDPKIRFHDLAAYTSVFADSTNTISAGQLVSGKFDDSFIPLGSLRQPAKSYTSYWLRFSFITTDSLPD